MKLDEAKIVPDLRVFEAISVSRDTGRQRLQKLIKQGVIDPKKTPTGRCLLSITEAERLAAEF